MVDHNPTVFDWNRARLNHRDNLPHIRQANVIYFVTFRLGDSLPAARVVELKARRDAWNQANPPPHSAEQEEEYRRIWTAKIERLLDAGYGSCVLRESNCRGFLESTMRHDDGVKYRLGGFVVMPNHAHALLQILPDGDLGEVIKAWKSVSARQLGKLLGRRGSYWMDEYFDHAVREGYLDKFIRYIRLNPIYLSPEEYTLGCGTLTVPPVSSSAEDL